jgi:hypothetical protein
MGTPAPAAAPEPPVAIRDSRRRPVILVEFAAVQPCPHQAFYGATPVQAVREIAHRLRLRTDQLGFRAGAFGQPDIFNREDTSPGVLASIVEGLNIDETRTARRACRAGALR